MSHINLITTCTNGKNGKEIKPIHLGDILDPTIQPNILISRWQKKISSALALNHKIPAVNLYKGAHWSIAKDIAKHSNTTLWVLSAGLGFLHYQDQVIPYQATFSANSTDSIPLFSSSYKKKQFHQVWWQALTQQSVLGNDPTGGIAALMKKKPDEYYIISGSPDYINATCLDIIDGIKHLHNPEKQLLIISSGATNPELNNFQLTSTAKIASFFKCNMLSLNITLAQYVINAINNISDIHLNSIKKSIQDEHALLPERPLRKGIRRSPEEVLQFLSQLFCSQPSVSASAALKTFRAEGNSFEEKRFRALYQQARQTKG